MRRLSFQSSVLLVLASLLYSALSNAEQSHSNYQGLWVGMVTIHAVSEPIAESTTPMPTATAFQFPLLLHIDGQGRSHLLKQVVMLWQGDQATVAQNERGHHLLLTDPALLQRYANLPGRRLSSAAIDYPGHQLPLKGTVFFDTMLSGTIALNPDLPTHPFRHRYHPDHNDPEEIYPIQRHIQLRFTQPQQTSTLSGDYSETISGLHQHDIVVAGNFALQKISNNAELNR